MPFTITISDASKTDLFDIKVKINNSKLHGKKDVEIIAELFVEYKKYSKEFVSFVSSIEEMEDKTPSASAIRVYIVKEGESLFNVAKALSVRPQDILTQNPSLDGNVCEGTRLVIYSPLDIDF